MPDTTNGLPYPVRTGVPPDVQNDIKKLAEAVDPTIAAAAAAAEVAARALPRVGQVSISYGGAASATATVVFNPPFTGAGTPTVMVTPTGNNSVPTTVGAAYGITNEGCTILIYTGDRSTHTGTRTVSYMAVKP